jgi:hypothetical protein
VALRKRGDDGVLRPYRLLVLEVEGERVARLRAYGETRALAALDPPRGFKADEVHSVSDAT